VETLRGSIERYAIQTVRNAIQIAGGVDQLLLDIHIARAREST
jgi:hypothetical protein